MTPFRANDTTESNTAARMPRQRRYSVTGQTPPDNPHPAGIKSPKLHALDTSVQAGCGLCDGISGNGPTTAAVAVLGESFETDVRTSSKRSATQLPSPVIMSNSHELPHKIARLGLENTAGGDIDVHVSSASLSMPEFQLGGMLDIEDSSISSPPESPFSGMESFNMDLYSPPSSTGSTTPTPTSTSLIVPCFAPIHPPQTPPTFETLPPEIRHQIYRHLPDLIRPHPLIYCLSTFRNLKQHPLASVSRLVRTEALAIFYAYNTWIIKLEFKIMYDAFREWMATLGDEGAGALRVVVVGVRSRRFRPRVRGAGGLGIGIANPGGQFNPFAFPFLMSSAPATAATTNAVQNTAPHTQIPPALAPGTANAVHNTAPHTQTPIPAPAPTPTPVQQEYCPPDGDASFRIDLSERFEGGKVELLRCDGSREAAEEGRLEMQRLVRGLWEKRCRGQLKGRDWVELVDGFLGWSGWWL